MQAYGIYQVLYRISMLHFFNDSNFDLGHVNNIMECFKENEMHFSFSLVRLLLSVPASQTVTHGDRRFAVAAANLCKHLPDSVRTAKTLPQYNTFKHF